MGENAKIKFCEECGNRSDIAAQFCDSCGNRYPEISDPGFQQAKFESEMGPQQTASPSGYEDPNQPLKPPEYIPKEQQNIVPQQPNQQPNIPPPQQYNQSPQQPNQPPQQFNPPPQQPFGGYQRPPPYNVAQQPYQTTNEIILRPWEGGNILNAATQIYRNPIQNGPPLLEDQSAPSSLPLVFLMALLTGFFTYLTFIKTTYTDVDVDEIYINQFTTESGQNSYAIQAGVGSFLVFFLIWLLGSWILGLFVKGGLPYNSYARHNATKSMRKLSGYRYFPFLVVHVILLGLLTQENNRTATVSMGSAGGFDQPIPEYTSDFSDLFITLQLILTIIAAVWSGLVFKRTLKEGLQHSGSSPVILAVLLAILNLNFAIPI